MDFSKIDIESMVWLQWEALCDFVAAKLPYEAMKLHAKFESYAECKGNIIKGELESLLKEIQSKLDGSTEPTARIVVTKKELSILFSKVKIHRGKNAISRLIKDEAYGLRNEPPSNVNAKKVSLFQSDYDRLRSMKSPL